MIEELERSRDEELDVQDDQARILLFEIGIVDKFKLKDYGRPITQAVVFNEHHTHHILALYHSGNADPKENGYQALCFPKSKMSLATFQLMADGFIKLSPEPPLDMQLFGGPPTNN